jgi:hypothetical protein
VRARAIMEAAGAAVGPAMGGGGGGGGSPMGGGGGIMEAAGIMETAVSMVGRFRFRRLLWRLRLTSVLVATTTTIATWFVGAC